MTLTAFHGKQKTKDFYIQRIKEHVAADQLVQGEGWNGHKGCHVGCLLHDYKHSRFPEQLGWPVWLGRLLDKLHEGQSKEDAAQFFMDFTPSVPVGFTENQFDRVKAKFFHWLLVDEALGVIRHAKTDRTKTAIQSVADLYALVISGEAVSKEQWKDAAADAYAAADADADAYADADADAYADAYAYAAAAAAAAADAAADADADAYAYAYAYAYAAAAKKQHFSKMAQKLIQLFKETA